MLGVPLNGPHTVRVELFDAAVGGISLHQEDLATTVEDGYYTVVLGEDPANPLQSSDLAGDVWLEITVDPPASPLAPRQKLTQVPSAATALEAQGAGTAGDGTTPQTAATTCNALHTADPTAPSGVYWIDPSGSNPVRTWCDMTTDGGGWTLASYAYAYGSAYHAANANHASLRCGGNPNYSDRWEIREPVFHPEYRGVEAGTLDSRALAAQSTEIAFSMASARRAVLDGDMDAYGTAYKFTIPDPAAVTFVNHSRLAPTYSQAGPCTAVTVTQIVGGTWSGTRYTLKNVLGVSWSDTFPTGYGAVDTSNCGNWSSGPFVSSVLSGSYSGSGSGLMSNQGCDVAIGNGYYAYLGNWTHTGGNNFGSSAIWFR